MFWLGLIIGIIAGGLGGLAGTYYFIYKKKISAAVKAKMAEIENEVDGIMEDVKAIKKTKVNDLDDALKGIRDKIIGWF